MKIADLMNNTKTKKGMNKSTIWKSSKQKIGTKNSTEDQLLALFDLYLVGLWLHEFLESVGVVLEKSVIYQDNKSAMAQVRSLLNYKPRSRHLNARRRVMYDEIMVNKSVDIAYLQTSEMIADILSKFAASIQGGKASYTKLKQHKWQGVHHGGIHHMDTGVRCILSTMECVRMRPM